MKRAPGRILAIGALCAVAYACGSETPLVARRHLADDEAAARGQVEPATAQLGAVTSYVLGEAPGRWHFRGSLTDAHGNSRLELTCEAGMAGTSVMVEVRTLPVPGLESGYVDVEPLTVRRTCPPDPRIPFVIEVPTGMAQKPLVHLVRLRVAPASRVTTAPLDVAARDELRLAVGLVGSRESQPLRVAVRAVGANGRRVPLMRTTVPADDQWHDLVAPLAGARAALGPSVRLEFKRQISRTQDRLAYVAIGNPVIWGPADSRSPRWSVLLVSLDTLRADRLGLHGYPLPVSPVLDALAREGTVFEHAVAQASWTLPSHATMLTGTYPCVHGLGSAGSGDNGAAARPTGDLLGRPLPVGVRPLAEILRDAGYYTAAFTENAYIDPSSFQRGFDEFGADKHVGWAAGVVEETVRSSVDWLRRHAAEPFFLFVHTYQVHEPYTPPPAYERLVTQRELPVAPGGLPPAPQAKLDAALYVGEVAYTDAAIGPLFAALAELGMADRTIVVVTSDHGEAFGEQDGAIGHATNIVEEQLHVPLIWRAPGLIAAGRRVPDLVGLVDIPPTLLALLGMETPPWMQGVSLVPMLAPGSSTASLPARLLPAEGYTMQGVRAADWKVTRRDDGSVAVVGVSATGVESRIPEPSESQTTGAFETVRRECERARSVLGSAGLARPSPTGAPLDPQREQKLRALGYLQ